MDDRYLELLELLLAKTKKKEANWVMDDDGDYQLLLKDSTVMLWTTTTTGVICVGVYNASNDQVKSLSDDEYPIISKLKAEVKNYFLRSDETLTNILAELSKPGIVGADEKKSELPF